MANSNRMRQNAASPRSASCRYEPQPQPCRSPRMTEGGYRRSPDGARGHPGRVAYARDEHLRSYAEPQRARYSVHRSRSRGASCESCVANREDCRRGRTQEPRRRSQSVSRSQHRSEHHRPQSHYRSGPDPNEYRNSPPSQRRSPEMNNDPRYERRTYERRQSDYAESDCLPPVSQCRGSEGQCRPSSNPPVAPMPRSSARSEPRNCPPCETTSQTDTEAYSQVQPSYCRNEPPPSQRYERDSEPILKDESQSCRACRTPKRSTHKPICEPCLPPPAPAPAPQAPRATPPAAAPQYCDPCYFTKKKPKKPKSFCDSCYKISVTPTNEATRNCSRSCPSRKNQKPQTVCLPPNGPSDYAEYKDFKSLALQNPLVVKSNPCIAQVPAKRSICGPCQSQQQLRQAPAQTPVQQYSSYCPSTCPVRSVSRYGLYGGFTPYTARNCFVPQNYFLSGGGSVDGAATKTHQRSSSATHRNRSRSQSSSYTQLKSEARRRSASTQKRLSGSGIGKCIKMSSPFKPKVNSTVSAIPSLCVLYKSRRTPKSNPVAAINSTAKSYKFKQNYPRLPGGRIAPYVSRPPTMILRAKPAKSTRLMSSGSINRRIQTTTTRRDKQQAQTQTQSRSTSKAPPVRLTVVKPKGAVSNITDRRDSPKKFKQRKHRQQSSQNTLVNTTTTIVTRSDTQAVEGTSIGTANMSNLVSHDYMANAILVREQSSHRRPVSIFLPSDNRPSWPAVPSISSRNRDSDSTTIEQVMNPNMQHFYRGSFVTVRMPNSRDEHDPAPGSSQLPNLRRNSLIQLAQYKLMKKTFPKGSSLVVPNKWQIVSKGSRAQVRNNAVFNIKKANERTKQNKTGWSWRKLCPNWLLGGKSKISTA